jgi:transcriptional regulator with XRE-family HTH domain
MDGLGARLTELRIKKGLSRSELAARVNVGTGTIGHLENEVRNPSIDLAIRLARELGVSLDTLMGTDAERISL